MTIAQGHVDVNADRGPLALPPGLRLHTRKLLKAYVNHSKSTGLWITTINTEEVKKGAKCNKSCLKAFSFSNENEAKETAYVNAPPTMMPQPVFCFMCEGRFNKILRRPLNCANCGVCVCNSCTVKWKSSMLPDTYKKKNAKTVRVCLTCDYLATAFRQAIESAHFERAKQIYMTGNVNLRCPFMNVRKGSEIMLPVHHAVASGDLKTLVWLVDLHYCPLKLINTGNRSKQMNTELIETSRGRTVIDIAVDKQRIDILRYLVNQKNISLSDCKNKDKASLAALEVVLRTHRTEESSDNDTSPAQIKPILKSPTNQTTHITPILRSPRNQTTHITPILKSPTNQTAHVAPTLKSPTNQRTHRRGSMTPTRQRSSPRSMTQARRRTPTRATTPTGSTSLVRPPTSPITPKNSTTPTARGQRSPRFDWETPMYTTDNIQLQTPPKAPSSVSSTDPPQRRREVAPPKKAVQRLSRTARPRSPSTTSRLPRTNPPSLTIDGNKYRKKSSEPRPLYNAVGPYDEEDDDDDDDDVKCDIDLDNSDCGDSVATHKEDECIICCVKTIDACFTPCGHQVCCIDCSQKVTRCPICSLECETIRIFRP